jgi:four helix bundle protein
MVNWSMGNDRLGESQNSPYCTAAGVAAFATPFPVATKCLVIDAGTPIAIQSAMRDWRDALEDRTQAFAQSAIDASVVLATLPGLRNAADQLNEAGTSVGANHRAMRRARSDREFAAKLQIVVEEADEAVFWLEVALKRSRSTIDLRPLLKEAGELRSIFAKARATTRNRRRGRGEDPRDSS